MAAPVWRMPSLTLDVVAWVAELFLDSRESASSHHRLDPSMAQSHLEQFYGANPQAHKMKPERQRDVLFGAGCGLLCFGLFPFSASVTIENGSKTATESSVVDEFDPTTRALSMAFSLLGFLCVTLSCVVLTRARLRAALLVIMAPMLVCIVTSCSTILQYSSLDDVVNVLSHTRVVSIDQEHRLELSVNSLFCEAHARTLCETQDVVRAMDIFDLKSLADIDATCSRLSHQQIDKSDFDPLTLIAEPSSTAMQWCGIYMTSAKEAALVEKERSPYHQHRLEVLDRIVRILAWRQARVKLLMVLEWFAVPAFLAVVWWWHSTSAKVQVAVRHIHVVV